MLPDGRGNLLIGTFWGGIDVLNTATGKMKHYRHIPGDPGSLSDNRVWALCREKGGGIWTGTSAGIDLFNPATGTFIHYPDLVSNKQVNWISTDSDNNLGSAQQTRLIIL